MGLDATRRGSLDVGTAPARAANFGRSIMHFAKSTAAVLTIVLSSLLSCAIAHADSASITSFNHLSGSQNANGTYRYTFSVGYRASITSQNAMRIGIYIEEFDNAGCTGGHGTIGNQAAFHGRGLSSQTVSVNVGQTRRTRGSFAPGIAFFDANSGQIYRQFGTDHTFCVNYGQW